MRRDLLIALRSRADAINPLVFFVLVVALFPLGVGAEPQTLAHIAPGVLWVGALLATLLALDNLFRADFADGTLEQWMLSPTPTAWLALAKIVSHWLVTGLPLVLMSPILGRMLFLSPVGVESLFWCLILATPTLSAIGSIGAALTVGLRRSGLLLAIVVLPLFVPVLVFGASGVASASVGLPYSGQLAILAAFAIASLVAAPWVVAAALRVSANS